MFQNQLTSRAQFDGIVKKAHWRLILLLVGIVTLYTGMVLVPDYTAKKQIDPGVFLAELDRLRWRMSKSEVEKIIGPLHSFPNSDFEFNSFVNTCGESWTMNVIFVRVKEEYFGLDRLQIIADGPNLKDCARCMEKQLRTAYGEPKDGRKVLAGFEEAFGPQEGVQPSDLLSFTKGMDKMEFDTIGGQKIRLWRQFRYSPLIASPSTVP